MRVSPCRTAARTSETRPEIAFCQTNPFLARTRTKETTCTHPRRSHLPPRPVTRNPLPIHRFSWWSSLRSLLLCAKHSSSSRHPMPPFEFATAARILFGEGTLRQVPAAAASLGRRALLVTGASPDRAAPLQKALQAAHVSTVPFAVPGSEVTRNAVLASPLHRVKASLRSASMLPRLAVVDPELTYHLPRAITASTGLDALTQLIEPYVSLRANPMTDQFCVEGMRRAASALPRVWENGGDRAARCDMAWASLL